MNPNPVATSIPYKATNALAIASFGTFLTSTFVCGVTIFINLTTIVLKHFSCLDTAMAYGYMHDPRGHFFINRHMGPLIAAAGLSLTVCLLSFAALDHFRNRSTTTQ